MTTRKITAKDGAAAVAMLDQEKAARAKTPKLAIVAKPKAAAPKKAVAKTAKKIVEAVGICRGKHSVCGGTEPSLSARWHLGRSCTDAFRAAGKGTAPKASPKVVAKVSAAKPAVRKAAPRPARVVHPRVPEAMAALIIPEVAPAD